MSLLPLLVDVGTTLEESSGLLQYLLVFVFAAIPIVEILVVIPIAIGLGLDPLATGLFAFAGNILSVYALIVFYRHIARWLEQRRGESDDSSDRYARARDLWDRYGVPGLAIASPVLTGVHIAALVALLAGSRTRAVAGWMTAGILAWTVALVAASAYGVSLLGLA
ncbi:small multi-drug export protein [Natronolimnobius baerhuensis]|uniref:Small multi-drug export protein n=1 Tax=Natronolimnobius baerhuensis TaxID=253108 RepID=A0A202ECS8_9EURY|nr:small multi-drug export protein [Natronolimnobius baerhuensis]OVE86025.1 small multi-drug export protein [Natronolimnobius baerhuensis]